MIFCLFHQSLIPSFVLFSILFNSTYYVTAMYGKKLRHTFHKLEQQQEQQQIQLHMMSTVTEEKEGKTNQEGCNYGSIDDKKE